MNNLPEDQSLGATCDGAGGNFALFSSAADRVELCLFDANDRETARVALERDGDIWRSHVPGLRVGQRYGYRVYGPYDPARGFRFNPHKLLIDPYATRLDRSFALAPAHFGYAAETGPREAVMDTRDSAPFTPKCVLSAVVRERFNPLNRTLADTILYELHVRGMTMLRRDIPEPLRGTFAGLASEPIIQHLRDLGVTTIELLPIHAIADEPRLVRAGFRNYWGYNSINFFAPEPRYFAGDPIQEIRRLIDQMHDAGIEVILDVVFNHSGEGDEWGPTLCFRGIDNAAYYRLLPWDLSQYGNDTACGNTMNVGHPVIHKMLLDALRWWAHTGVDGFRFDLASILAKPDGQFQSDAPFLTDITGDPELAKLKLVAEPWDATPSGYRLGGFPKRFSEWNDRYRDTMRRFWRGDRGLVGEYATRISGSSDFFATRGPLTSINFITAHDGFTLQDLVSYSVRRNWANGENNADGATENYSWNCGVEGETGNPDVQSLRLRQKRNLIATLLLSLGVPMMTAGDELGRTQKGNNNAYCQDNEISWINWDVDTDEQQFFRFVKRIIGLRSRHPVFRRTAFYRGDGENLLAKDIAWLTPAGKEMTPGDWSNPANHHLASTFRSEQSGARYYLAFNASAEPETFILPVLERSIWKLLLDTAAPDGGEEIERVATDWRVAERSLVLLFRPDESV